MLKQAKLDGIIQTNPGERVTPVKQEETKREFQEICRSIQQGIPMLPYNFPRELIFLLSASCWGTNH
ncbi:hypothetical protein ADIS_0156 [Lunatimonas lonarensis]|uniref:Uncharacterized protein n=1 Tax=Lunatimonas lonarensis TaxID=1232681 RepID=R7ZZ72_9BACT|nr:hypothetical protein ADIS_0156 [Lunatimonas lonarensis]